MPKIEEDTPKFIIWGHHYSYTKPRQKHYKKRKRERDLHDNTVDESRCKNPQQNIGKPNLSINKKDHTPQLSVIYPGDAKMVPSSQINVICHIPKEV